MSAASLEEVLQEVQVGDIVLTSTRGWIGTLVRYLSRSRWAHVTMVFECIPRGDGSQDVLLIEAVDENVQIHHIEKYSKARGGQIGIRRVPGLTAKERERIRGFFLDALDAPYDTVRLFGFMLGTSMARLFRIAFPTKLLAPLISYDKYVCSSLIQRAYYLAVKPSRRADILFQPIKPSLKHQLEFITPADIAQSKNAVWLYHP